MSDRHLNEMDDQAKTNVRAENTSKEEVLYERNEQSNKSTTDSEQSNKSNEIIKISCMIEATSMTLADNNMVWVMSYKSPTMYLYNEKGRVVEYEGRTIESVTLEGSNGIKDMALTRSGDMIVTCKDKKVRRVSMNGGKTVLRDTKPFDCEGVCLNDKEEIIVCMRGQKNGNHVAVYSADGDRKLFGWVDQEEQITEPYRVVHNGQNLCVVNQGRNVVCVDMNGKFQWMYKDEQAESDKPFNPLGICVHQTTNLLVSDHYNRVYQINGAGKLLKRILKDLEPQKGSLFQRYWGICVDDTGRVWIGNAEKDIVIAELKNKSDENQPRKNITA